MRKAPRPWYESRMVGKPDKVKGGLIFATNPKTEKITELSFKGDIMSFGIHGQPASGFQFLGSCKSKAKPQGDLNDRDGFNRHLKKMEMNTDRRPVDTMEISRHQADSKAHTYGPPRCSEKAIGQQPPQADEAANPVLADNTGPGLPSAAISEILQWLEEYLSRASGQGAEEQIYITIALSSIEKALCTERGETSKPAADYQNEFVDKAQAYAQVHEFLRIRHADDETKFGQQLLKLNAAFRNVLDLDSRKRALKVATQFEYDSMRQSPDRPVICVGDYRDQEFVKSLGTAEQSTLHHTDIFFDTFLKSHQNGYDSALAASLEALKSSPISTSEPLIPFTDMGILYEAVSKPDFAYSLDNEIFKGLMDSSELSDFTKQYLEEKTIAVNARLEVIAAEKQKVAQLIVKLAQMIGEKMADEAELNAKLGQIDLNLICEADVVGLITILGQMVDEKLVAEADVAEINKLFLNNYGCLASEEKFLQPHRLYGNGFATRTK